MPDEIEPRLVTAVGVSVNGAILLNEHAVRIERAIVAEILLCNEEGISTEEKNSPIIKERMMMAREREQKMIEAEIEERQKNV